MSSSIAVAIHELENGFLPSPDPLRTLPSAYREWEWLARNLPKILTFGKTRQLIEQLPPFDTHQLNTSAEWERAMMILSYLGHAYVWGAEQPPKQLPAILARPWYEVASRLERPPVLSYASYALNNWQRHDPEGPVEIGNISLLQNFAGGIDEEWFILIHIEIESKAIPAIQALLPGQEAVTEGDARALNQYLCQIKSSLEEMCKTLDRMPENCDPYIYFNRVRPYIHGWKNNPSLPEGLLYEGVDEYQGQPQLFRGETGAQSTIIPALDAFLNISHEEDMLHIYLKELRQYMPVPHLRFLQQVEAGAPVREFVIRMQRELPELMENYNACVKLIERFRHTHLSFASNYIHKQSRDSAMNPHAVGTGGTPFMPYLKKHQDETASHLV